MLVDGRPYITRDALLHIAHRSGQFDGIEMTEPVLDGDYWRATATVYRKDMAQPFTYPGRYPVKGKNTRFAPEMAIKVAESMALRRAFDVAAPDRRGALGPRPARAAGGAADARRAGGAEAQRAGGQPRADALAAQVEDGDARQVEDGEPELLGDPMTEAESAGHPADVRCRGQEPRHG